ncbi:hypothetical protein SEA_PONS_26 [Gordonia phage Pons]|uniref:Uncharacterized protein n=2 Tax=Ponsvirus TaxID=3044795 RepID=A0AAE8YAB3_9CAUD|nr:hypothetical protein PP992_gp26 [Gordonia phage Pons]YP_010663088.1 hypothetical protein PP993_gp27 [Gordonia phage Mayweather]QDP45189.1 hypothetical protein SEA_MAYWEATHER_27 [Gordonia phage Mayweather]UDL15186.1 hypothetical protein SEA_PONS_26 [Gordonia phage Pons]
MRYVVAIAGHNASNVSVTFIPDYCWDLFHKAFGRDSLANMWWFTPAAEALPVIDDALAYFDDHHEELKTLFDSRDWRGVGGNRQVLARIRQDLAAFDDNVIAWGVEDGVPDSA